MKRIWSPQQKLGTTAVGLCLSALVAHTLLLSQTPTQAANPATTTKEKPASTEAAADAHASSTGLKWVTWTDDLFDRATKENKLVILDLEAVWCHWCHVMDEKTYSNPEVAQLLRDHFICVKVDQDARPDLSTRYDDYGWPATIFFDSKGAELAKRQGFIRPGDMVELLRKLVAKPTPEEEAKQSAAIQYSASSSLPKALHDQLLKKHIDGYDAEQGAWGFGHKFLDWDSVEFALSRAHQGNAQAAQMAKKTMIGQINLIDPVWGGVYQYSTDGDWNHKHFEKIMQMQGENLKIYALGTMYFKDPRFQKAALDIEKYLRTMLMSPDGAFYTSQDADVKKGQHSEWYFKLSDAERRKYGIPRIDKHIYARENGWAINGLAWLYRATGNKKFLDEATRAADWIIKNRSLPSGGFSHDANDSSGPYLGDTLYMGRAFLTLYEATGDRKWLTRSQDAANFISAHFQDKNHAGFVSSDASKGGIHKPQPILEENIALCRWLNLLHHYSGNKQDKTMAQSCMRYLATPEIANMRQILVAGTLLCDNELSAEPPHITIVGKKADPVAKSLFLEANKYPLSYKRVEWFDRAEGPMPNSDVEYPEMPKAAAFSCAGQRCSRPVYTVIEVTPLIEKMTKPAKRGG
ncbi:MAG: DUF255 domain-containing protein [Candidatus Obscuribacterales bacterium]|nr:DUF255 domain-containing protein [Candidatus Obscuribacterales bacterium]